MAPTDHSALDEAAVDRVQDHLRRFGYLQPEDAGQARGVMTPRATAGTLDDATRQALRGYQRFHGLPATGEPDDATVAHMSLPRCGVPDVAPNAGLSQFVASGDRWPTTKLRYGFVNFTGDLTAAQVR
jgi:hypothetical protein